MIHLNSKQLQDHLSLVMVDEADSLHLKNVLFHADAETQQVTLTALDLSLGICTSFAAQVKDSARFILPAKKFYEIVMRLPQGGLTIGVIFRENAETNIESLTTTAIATLFSGVGRYRIQLRGADARDFPELPAIENGFSAQLSAKALLEGLRGSLFAASADETKQALTGIHLVVTESGLEFAATDGHRLAVVRTSNELEENSTSQVLEPGAFEVTIPTRAWRELERMLVLHDCECSIQLYFDPGQAQVVFKFLNQWLTTRTLEGQYPAYWKFLSGGSYRQVVVDRKQLLQALELISVLVADNVVISLDADSDRVHIKTGLQDIGNGVQTLDAAISGESIDVVFNVKYLMELLENLQASQVQIQLNTATSPAIIQSLGDTKITYLIMPVQY